MEMWVELGSNNTYRCRVTLHAMLHYWPEHKKIMVAKLFKLKIPSSSETHLI